MLSTQKEDVDVDVVCPHCGTTILEAKVAGFFMECPTCGSRV